MRQPVVPSPWIKLKMEIFGINKIWKWHLVHIALMKYFCSGLQIFMIKQI